MCGTHRDIRDGHKMLILNPKGNALLGGPTIRWDDNIKMHLKERRCESVDCFHFGQDTIQWLL
jgi:hypothetical protein